MGKPVQRPRGKRLDKGLCVDDFEICVPIKSKLLMDWERDSDWANYVEDLRKQHRNYFNAEPTPYQHPLTTEYSNGTNEELERCYSCDCKEGRPLRGELAVAHACRVHDRIHRQILSLQQVSAVDVGFAISERRTAFEKFLSLRVHVNRKLPVEQLLRAGLASFTQATFALADRDSATPFVFKRFFGTNMQAHSLQTDEAHDVPCPPPTAPPDESCCNGKSTCDERRKKHLMRLVRREARQFGDYWRTLLSLRYPITGIDREDLSIFCPNSIDKTRSLEDVRLCICGVPLDIVNARYRASITHPGGDADSGVFAEPPKRSDDLTHEEVGLVGRGRVNPLVGGVSVGTVTGLAGTLGTIVWDRTDATPCVLSNWHVLAGTPTAQVGQPIYQPALFDGGTDSDAVAHLKRWHLGEEGDAAIAELAGNRHYAAGEILGLWNPVSGNIRPRLNMKVRKLGRTTVFTQGFVDGICLATNIDYGNDVVRYFRDQFRIAPLYAGEDVSQPGDSGALVVTRFKPEKQQRNLKRLAEWLIAGCQADGFRALCLSIEKGIRDLRERAGEHGCKLLFDLLEEAKFKDICCSDQPDVEELCKALCDLLKDDDCPDGCEPETLLQVCDCYRRIVYQLKLAERQLAELERAFETCKLEGDDACDRAKEILKHVNTVWPYPNDCHDCEIDCKTCGPWLSEEFNKAIHCVGEKRAAAERCLELCIEATKGFEGWRERCCAIEKSRALSEKVCDALLREECKENGAEEVQNNDRWPCHSEDDFPYRSFESWKCTDPNDLAQHIQRILDGCPEQCQKKHSDKDDSPNCEDPRRAAVLEKKIDEFIDHEESREERQALRANFAVGLIFAGDTPGSPFGEFAIASDIQCLEDELRFSLRPVFEPRSSFRELRVRPQTRSAFIDAQRVRPLMPGEARGSEESQVPTPIPRTVQPGSGGGG